jgi:diguanylate cyclase (GGDEF)-like protein
MRQKHYFILAASISLFYWLFDAYTNASLYQTSFIDELLLRSPHTVVFMKILTALLLFLLALVPMFLQKKLQPKKQTTSAINEFQELQRIADILFSSLSTKINTLKSLELLEETLHLESTMLFLYRQDAFMLYNENAFIKTHFRTKEIIPSKSTTERSTVEQVAIDCFVEKRPFSKNDVRIDKHPMSLFSFELKEDRSERPLGNLMLATKTPHLIETYLPMIHRFVQMLTFALSVSVKKELLQSLNTQHASESGTYDQMLDIMNYPKLQEYIEHEFKRHKRYHTALSIVLVEINLLKNISNIFSQEVIAAFKKELIQLIKKNTREVDVCAKWSNDRFAILLPDVDFRAGQSVARKLQAILGNTKFPRIGNITCSFGITSLAPKDTIASFRSRAENALSTASSREAANAIEVKLHA